MMDNYEQARISTERLKNLDDVHQINFQQRTEFYQRVEGFNSKHQNFQFGANIMSTKVATTISSSTPSSALNISGSCSSEEETKTNMKDEIKTITKSANGELQILSSITDTPVSVEDEDKDEILEDSSECFAENQEAEGDDDEDEEEEDSYQTDYNEVSQISQDMENKSENPESKNYEEDEDNPDEDTDESSSDSDFSDLSGLSDMSGREWKPISQRPLNWVQKQIHSGVNPREILSKFLPTSAQRISPELTDMTLWRILASMLSEPPRRKKLSYINTFDDVIDLLHKSKNIIVLTGAGVSVSCGIPDFRSSDGIYSRLAKDFPNLPDPQAMFDINYFSRDPRPFFKFAREIYPGQFKPSPCHRFIKMLEQKQKLLRNYTQNIDTLEQVAGIRNVIECHGSFSTASCTKCKYKCDADSIRADIFSQRIPVCPRCQPNVEQSVDASEPVSEMELRQLVENGIMKPDIVFFGEGLPDEFHTVMASDKDQCDLLIVMGSSLKVRPVALIPSSIPNNVPQILINREQLHHLEFDVELLGDGDVIINQICHRLGNEWKDICFNSEVLHESSELKSIDDEDFAKEILALTDTDCDSLKTEQSTDLIINSETECESSSAICPMKKPVEFLPPDFLEEPIETTGFVGSCDYRHLSIDSSKDSGMGDASNSANTPVYNNFVDPATDLNKSNLNMPASTTQAIASNVAVDNIHNKKMADTNCTETEKHRLRRQRRHQSTAERLQVGTFYSHSLTSSYVFPGAQVSWGSDTEDDLDDEDLNCVGLTTKQKNLVDDYDETNHAPLSPLMTPSVENEMVKAITTNAQTSASSNSFAYVISSNTASSSSTAARAGAVTIQQKKRQSYESEECSNGNTNDVKLNNIVSTNSPPPNKKRRDFVKSSNITASASASIISCSATSNGNSLEST